MHVLCKRANNAGDVRCKICGQGFLIYWARTASSERDSVRRQIVEALSQQHTASYAGHPRTGFTICATGSGWSGAPESTGTEPPRLYLAIGDPRRTV
jgi:hypothetical protein